MTGFGRTLEHGWMTGYQVDAYNVPLIEAVKAYSDEPACKAVLDVAEALGVLRRTLDAEPVSQEMEAWRRLRVQKAKAHREVARQVHLQSPVSINHGPSPTVVHYPCQRQRNGVGKFRGLK
jgi:hypothetical protein